MTYVKVSIPRAGDNAGAPIPKNPTVIVMLADDVETEPVRSNGNVEMTGDYALKEGATAIGIYATPSTIEQSEEVSGDADAKGVTKGVSFQHPGDDVAISNFIEGTLNKGVIILLRQCDGTSDGVCKVFGSKCNPLYLEIETTINNEATRRTLTYKQAMADAFMPGVYTGTLPSLASESSSSNEGA